MDSLETKDFLKAEDALAQIGKIIEKMNDILGRIHERCKPDVFYHRIRPFLRGSRGIPSLPRGVFYDKGDMKGEWRGYRGGSNGQSALFHFLDIVLGVRHKPFRSTTSLASGVGTSDDFFREMVEYMPRHHRRLLSSFATRENLRDLIMSTVGKPYYAGLWKAYRTATERLVELRNSHMRIVARYIIVPSRTDRNAEIGGDGLIGTGSTALIPFLRQSRNETFHAVEFDAV
ncbi:indoleamine-dioxygenase [Colletotrichum chrysophilum]|uniref:Indoleamine-dioxygenase n=1 Tax=Colletotrichum chrysophilum TaxID=1836956 RepID=A0AAD9A0E1_9PEZI|nr:indoleamine-dioxygenase [Colletotrichum chrysophilum]